MESGTRDLNWPCCFQFRQDLWRLSVQEKEAQDQQEGGRYTRHSRSVQNRKNDTIPE